jgi:hypothetical protein
MLAKPRCHGVRKGCIVPAFASAPRKHKLAPTLASLGALVPFGLTATTRCAHGTRVLRAGFRGKPASHKPTPTRGGKKRTAAE